ncbi:MAG: beta-galactosidase, partial [Armatimonadetes bacterium]|nr:beta-galactosidase [Armatimonadota bacterium]
AEALARKADETLDEGDELIGGLSGTEAAAAYAQAATALQQATAACERSNAALRQAVLARGAKPLQLNAGSPLWVGPTHVNGGLAYPSGPSRQWFYEQTLSRMKRELAWNVFDIVVGGYGASEVRPDGKDLRPEALDDIAAAARDSGMAMILCTVQGVFGKPDQPTPYTAAARAARARALKQMAAHFGPLAACYGFEPNNEPGLGVKPDTMFGYNDDTLAEFRAWLQQRFGDLAKLNAALGTHFTSTPEIVPPRPEAMAQISTDDPRRALWAAWIEFRFDLMERLHRSDYEALRSVGRKPIFDRTAGDGMNWCGVPASGALHAARQDRRSRWHDALGSHVITPFLLDYQVGMSRGRRLVQSEYYWSTYGGPSDGVRYRFGGNFMHPILQNESRNFAAVERNLWKAVSRGNDLFTIYFGSPTNAYSQFDEGYWGPHTTYWGDQSFKGMTYAMEAVPEAINRFRGELIGARHVPQVGLLEPLASIVHTIGTPVATDIRDPQYEAEALHKLLLGTHVQTEIVGEWRLLEGPPPAVPAGQSVSAMPLDLPPVLVVPYGVFLSRATQDKLAEWVGHGGTLIATGPVGLYDEAGRAAAQLLKAVFPRLEVKRGDGADAKLSGGATVRRRWSFTGVPTEQTYPDGTGAVLRGKLGQGEVIVTGFAHLDGPDAVAALVQQAVARHAPPQVDTDNASVQLYLCRRANVGLLYVINEDHTHPQPARLTFRQPHEVADLRLGLNLGVRPGLVLTLLPGEGRVLRLTPR